MLDTLDLLDARIDALDKERAKLVQEFNAEKAKMMHSPTPAKLREGKRNLDKLVKRMDALFAEADKIKADIERLKQVF